MTPLELPALVELRSIAPEILLTLTGVLVLLLDAFLPALRRAATALALAGVALAAQAAFTVVPRGESFGGLLEFDGVSLGISVIVLLSTALALLASHGYLTREGIFGGEYHALLLWCSTGGLFLARATELLTVFVALELLSICLYALAGYDRKHAIATEGAIKYFLMGAFVSAFALLGVALLYAESGSTRLEGVQEVLQTAGTPPLAVLGLLLLVAAFAFKLSLVPFHAWSPDTYQGASASFVAFLSVVPKTVSAVVLVRLLLVAGAALGEARWSALVTLLCILSMVVGNLVALVQRDLKRMLAYSGIAHMGYLLIPLTSWGAGSWEPVLVYLLSYALMNAGAFIMVGMLYARPGEQHLITELSGRWSRHPWLAAGLSLCMLSLGGIPPTFGFIGKYSVFLHAVRQGQMGLVLVAVGTSLLGVFYYLRVVYTLYMRPTGIAEGAPPADAWGGVAAVVAAVATLILGVWPTGVMEWIAGLLGSVS